MSKSAVTNAAVLGCALLASLLAAEGVVRILGHTDADGNFMIFNVPLPPFKPPVQAIEAKLATWRESEEHSTIAAHSALGWAPRPNSRTADGMYVYNAAGIRAAEASEVYGPKAEGVFRIALFGDSFTQAAEVRFEDSWSCLLDGYLEDAGIAVEVLNFGYGGYGMDQAYLRWKLEGKRFSPDLVVFGLQVENVKRNLNLIRQLYIRRTDIPFSKPRFELRGDSLVLLNVPTVPPDSLPAVLADLPGWRLRTAEHFYDSESYRDGSWMMSRLVSLARVGLLATRERTTFYAMDTEGARLALRIIAAFRHDVEESGADFLIVHLPKKEDLKAFIHGKPFIYDELLAHLTVEYEVVRPEVLMADAARRRGLGSLYLEHYSPEGNRVVARAVAEHVLAK